MTTSALLGAGWEDDSLEVLWRDSDRAHAPTSIRRRADRPPQERSAQAAHRITRIVRDSRRTWTNHSRQLLSDIPGAIHVPSWPRSRPCYPNGSQMPWSQNCGRKRTLTFTFWPLKQRRPHCRVSRSRRLPRARRSGRHDSGRLRAPALDGGHDGSDALTGIPHTVVPIAAGASVPRSGRRPRHRRWRRPQTTDDPASWSV